MRFEQKLSRFREAFTQKLDSVSTLNAPNAKIQLLRSKISQRTKGSLFSLNLKP